MSDSTKITPLEKGRTIVSSASWSPLVIQEVDVDNEMYICSNAILGSVGVPFSGSQPCDYPTTVSDRAIWAKAALEAFIAETGVSKDYAVSGLVCALLHLCDKDPTYGDTQDIIKNAGNNLMEEVRGERMRDSNAIPGPAGLPPNGWVHADEMCQDNFNRWGNEPFSAFFERKEGGYNSPTCHLSILWDGQKFRAAHGSVKMNELVCSADEAADIALKWYADWSAENRAYRPHAGAETLPKKIRVSNLGM